MTMSKFKGMLQNLPLTSFISLVAKNVNDASESTLILTQFFTMTSEGGFDRDMMLEALLEAKKCKPRPGAFCVGCVLVSKRGKDSPPVVLARGYSRELEGNTHAEANALAKARCLSKERLQELFPDARDDTLNIPDILRKTDVYTTMEPCSVRTSGLAPCADALIEADIQRCFIGVGEPDDFVNCEGAQKLEKAGIEVIWLRGLGKACLDAARAVAQTEEMT